MGLFVERCRRRFASTSHAIPSAILTSSPQQVRGLHVGLVARFPRFAVSLRSQAHALTLTCRCVPSWSGALYWAAIHSVLSVP